MPRLLPLILIALLAPLPGCLSQRILGQSRDGRGRPIRELVPIDAGTTPRPIEGRFVGTVDEGGVRTRRFQFRGPLAGDASRIIEVRVGNPLRERWHDGEYADCDFEWAVRSRAGYLAKHALYVITVPVDIVTAPIWVPLMFIVGPG